MASLPGLLEQLPSSLPAETFQLANVPSPGDAFPPIINESWNQLNHFDVFKEYEIILCFCVNSRVIYRSLALCS